MCLPYLYNSCARDKALLSANPIQIHKGEKIQECLDYGILSDGMLLQDSNFKLLFWLELANSLALALNLSKVDI